MINWFWKLVGALATSERGFAWLQRLTDRDSRQYSNIWHKGALYMGRWWVLKRHWNLPSVRLHFIARPDLARNLHSHPFNFRTIILRGWYMQEIPGKHWPSQKNDTRIVKMVQGMQATCYYNKGGETSNFHRITQVSRNGCWTLFIMWGGKRHDWGFMTKAGYVPAAEYKDQYKVENV